jgi:hypothetical protein
MFKRPGEVDEEPTLDELMIMAEQERLALAGKGKGSAKLKLQEHRDDLTKMLQKGLPVPVIRELLEKVGTAVNVKSLFKFLREDMSDEYTAYLTSTGRGSKKNRANPAPQVEVIPNPQVGANKEATAPTPAPQVEANNKEQATPGEATTAIAAKSEKSGGMKTVADLRKNADSHDWDQYGDN